MFYCSIFRLEENLIIFNLHGSFLFFNPISTEIQSIKAASLQFFVNFDSLSNPRFSIPLGSKTKYKIEEDLVCYQLKHKVEH